MADTSNKLTVSVCGKKKLPQNLRSDVYTLNLWYVIITDSIPLGIAMDHD